MIFYVKSSIFSPLDVHFSNLKSFYKTSYPFHHPITGFICTRPYVIGYKCRYRYSVYLTSPSGQFLKDISKSSIFSYKPRWMPPHNLPGPSVSCVFFRFCIFIFSFFYFHFFVFIFIFSFFYLRFFLIFPIHFSFFSLSFCTDSLKFFFHTLSNLLL